MSVHTVTVHNVRSYELFSIETNPETTLILGPNGTGKTTLLEATYFLYRGTSFRGRDRDMIPHGQLSAELKLNFLNGETRRASLKVESDGRVSKSFMIGDKKSARLSSSQRLPVVLFEPDELRLLTSSPNRRREFIDGIIARLSPTYSTVLSRFSRTLLQRNELLKQFDGMQYDEWQRHLFVWDIKLAELGATIIKARRNFVAHCNEHLSRLYSSLAGTAHTVEANYVSLLGGDIDGLQQALLSALERSHTIDARRGYTSIGPHRDDIEVYLDNYPAAESASRGEMRSIMLSFKLLEVELQEHHSGLKPLLLLDDVFSELDTQREHALIKALAAYQTIITATDLRKELKEQATIYTLKNQ